MSFKKVITGLIFTTLSFVAINANAALMNVGGVEVMVADVDKYGKGPSSEGTPPELLSFFSGANIMSDSNSDYEFTITFLYKQAGFENVFRAPDGQTLNTDAMENDMISGTFSVGAGEYMTFSFGANCDATFMGCTDVANGMNTDSESSSNPNFAVSEIMMSGDETSFYLFLNDTGAGPDVDFDDLIVFVQLVDVTEPPTGVPEPSTILLLALGALGLARFKK